MTELVLGQGDIVTAAVEFLLAGDDIAEVMEGRVFGFELPDDESEFMPRPAIVVGEAGGFTQGLPEVMDRARLDIRSYGSTVDQAKAVAVLVGLRMSTLRRYAAANGVLLHPAVRSGGYIPLRSPTGGWPFVLRTYLQPYDTRAVA